MINASLIARSTHNLVSDDIEKDAALLFTAQKQGHMERWEYASSMFFGDPAGGGDYWAHLIENPGRYYLAKGDIETIQWAIGKDDLAKNTYNVEAVVELGPGSEKAILSKTIPFLEGCPNVKKYIAVDATLDQAMQAGRMVQGALSISSGARAQNYIKYSIDLSLQGKTAFIMWGSSISNLDGFAGENPFYKLTETLKKFKSNLKSGDLFIFCFDTEKDEQKILDAYNEYYLHSQILSPLHRLKRDGYATGFFDPRIWFYEPVWFPEYSQCAHTIYPIFDQIINLAGLTIKIPAWRRFITNNSYKFSPATMSGAVKTAGFKPLSCFAQGPIAMIVAEA